MREISCYMTLHVSSCICVSFLGDCARYANSGLRCFSLLQLLVASFGFLSGSCLGSPWSPYVSACIKPYQAIKDVDRCRQMSKEPRLRKGLSRLEQFRRPVPVRIHGRRFQCSRFPFPVSLQFSTKYTLRVCFPMFSPCSPCWSFIYHWRSVQECKCSSNTNLLWRSLSGRCRRWGPRLRRQQFWTHCYRWFSKVEGW